MDPVSGLESFYDKLKSMEDNLFEGSVVLERLAEINKVDDFYEAVDADDFSLIRTLLREAGLDESTIEIVLNMVAEGD